MPNKVQVIKTKTHPKNDTAHQYLNSNKLNPPPQIGLTHYLIQLRFKSFCLEAWRGRQNGREKDNADKKSEKYLGERGLRANIEML